MRKILAVCISILFILTIAGGACSQPPATSREGSQRVAKEFVRLETTFRFDGIEDTLEATGTTSVGGGWSFTIEFDSRHAGYGNRSGQILAQVITHHTAEVTVQSGQVTAATMDGVWDMVNQQMIENIEIDLAPIHEVSINYMKSNPPQISVHIKGGLRDGCTEFHSIETTRQDSAINIKVTTRHPKDVSCPAVYTYFEKDVELGSDFPTGVTYTVNVNNYTTTFTY